MSLEQTIMADLKTAMKAKDDAAKRSIRSIKAEILKFKTSGSGEEFTEEAGIKILTKMAKQRQDSADVYTKQGRDDLAQTELEEIAVIKKYLPKQMDEKEITVIVQAIIDKVGAASMKDMGKVMGMASKEMAGKSEGKVISGIVRKLLS